MFCFVYDKLQAISDAENDDADASEGAQESLAYSDEGPPSDNEPAVAAVLIESAEGSNMCEEILPLSA